MGRGGYGTTSFWAEWFEDHREPYDWLLEYDDIGPVLEALLGYDHTARILVVGAGNSPFSSDLFARGYRDIVNVDNCEEVVETQRRRYPMLRWLVADVRALPFSDASFDFVIDKGLLDNLYCLVDPETAVDEFVEELSRVLRPRARFIAISCHDEETTSRSLRRSWWHFASTTIPNPRWPTIQIPTYQLAVCQKHPQDLTKVLNDVTSPSSPPKAPSRLEHLEDRASGRRHASLLNNTESHER